MFFKTGVRKFAYFTGKYFCRVCNFIKKRPQHSCFPCDILTFLRTLFFTEHLRWLFLFILKSKSVTTAPSMVLETDAFTLSALNYFSEFPPALWDSRKYFQLLQDALKDVLLSQETSFVTWKLFKMMKSALYFTVKAFFVFVLNIFKFFFLVIEDWINFKIYGVGTWEANWCITHCPISHEVKATRQWNCSVNRI